MTKTIRAFIALQLPSEIKDYLQDLSQQLASQLTADPVKWIKRHTMHLTLIFIGDGVTPANVTQLSNVLDQVAAATPPFPLQLSKLGCFPKPKAPRILWVGLGGQTDTLHTLKNQLDQKLEPLGWPPEKRRYNPHLTLGRVKRDHNIGRAFLPFGEPVRPLTLSATAVHLYKSTLTPQGPRYNILHTSNFRNQLQ